MRAIKMDVIIGPEKQLFIDLPDDIPKGTAELILLTHDNSEADKKAQTDNFREWLEELIQKNPLETPRQMLDRRIEALRNEWD